MKLRILLPASWAAALASGWTLAANVYNWIEVWTGVDGTGFRVRDLAASSAAAD